MNTPYSLCQLLTSNTCSDDEIIEHLSGISEKGETVEDLVGMGQFLREQSIKIPLPNSDLLDVCGTGGSGIQRMNVSTTTAFLLASMGIPVAKHGNRASSGISGSFDMLEALGIPTTQSPFTIAKTVKLLGIGFIYAPLYHPILKNVAHARKKYGKRTIFNLLGPLLNPTAPKYQLIGTTTPRFAEIIAHASLQLGTEKVTVVCGEDGLDDVTLTGTTTVFTGDKNGVTKSIFDPREIGLARIRDAREIGGGTPVQNAQYMLQLLAGNGAPALHALTCLNAAFALKTYHNTKSIHESYLQADAALRSGRALRLFYDYKALAQQLTI